MNELINKIERKEVVVIERPSIDVVMGGAIIGDSDTTQKEFLDKLAKSLKMVEDNNGMCPGNIEIITDGNGNFVAKMDMGYKR